MNYKKAFPSKYLSSADLDGKSFTLTLKTFQMEEVENEGRREDKLVGYFEGAKKGMIFNVTNCGNMAQITGSEDTDEWVGATINIWNDPNVMFGKKRTGGLRVRSPIPEDDEPKPDPLPTAQDVALIISDDDLPF